MLVQVAYNPAVMLPYSKLGEEHEVTVQDASQLAAEGEVLSYWQLMVSLAALVSRQSTAPLWGTARCWPLLLGTLLCQAVARAPAPTLMPSNLVLKSSHSDAQQHGAGRWLTCYPAIQDQGTVT